MNNIIVQGIGFHISYNPNTSTLGSGFQGDVLDETAIVVSGKYYILNGNYLKEYQAIIDDGLAACMQVFHSNIKNKSSWSDT